MKHSVVIVTGAAGFIGSHTVERLLAEGHTVIGIDNLSTGHLKNLARARLSQRFHFVEANMMDPGLLEELCQEFRADSIIHLVGLVSVVEAQRNPASNFTLNLHATHIVGEAAMRTKVRRLVFASSAATYGDSSDLPLRETSDASPISAYGAAKLASEKYLLGFRSYGIDVIFNRYFNVYGPRQDPGSPYSGVISIFGDRFISGEAVTIFGDGKQTRDFISVFDVATANWLAATLPRSLPSGPINICTGASRNINDLVEVFQSIYPNCPDPQYLPFRNGEILDSAGDSRLAKKILGFEAGITLEQGIRQLTGRFSDPDLAANNVSYETISV